MSLTYTDYAWSLPDLGMKYDTRIASITNRLASGHYVPAKLSLELCHPRPDSETDSYCYARNAYPAIKRRIPVAAIGGALPHWFELVDGPSGATVGAAFGDTDYGILNIPNPTAGTHNITVRIIDQDLNVVTARWSIVCGTDNFVFVAETGANGGVGNDATGDGLIGNPYKTLDGVFLDSATTSVHTNKEVILRSAATQITYNHPDYQLRLAQATNTKPATISGHYGDETQPITDCDTHKMVTPSGDSWAVVNIDFQNSPGDNSGAKDSRFINCNQITDYYCSFENNFSAMSPGDSVTYPSTVGNDNPAAMYFNSNSTQRKYGYIGHNTLDDSSCAMYVIYTNDKCVYEFNEEINARAVRATNSDYGFRPKASISGSSFRYEECWDGVEDIGGGCFNLTGQEDSGFLSHNVEVAYCKLQSGVDAVDPSIKMMYSGTVDANTRDIYLTRNTFVGKWLYLDRTYNVVMTGNISVTDGQSYPSAGVDRTVVNTDNSDYAISANPLDSSLNLPVEHTDYGKKGTVIA